MVADHDPGGDTNLSHLRSGVVGHDHVGTKRRRLPVEGIRVGEAHVVVRALLQMLWASVCRYMVGAIASSMRISTRVESLHPNVFPCGEGPETVAFLGFIPVLETNQALYVQAGGKYVEVCT